MTTANFEEILKELREIRRVSTMETAHFGSMDEKNDYPTNEKEVTPFIQQRTRLWRETWITGQLDWIIEDLEKLSKK